MVLVHVVVDVRNGKLVVTAALKPEAKRILLFEPYQHFACFELLGCVLIYHICYFINVKL